MTSHFIKCAALALCFLFQVNTAPSNSAHDHNQQDPAAQHTDAPSPAPAIPATEPSNKPPAKNADREYPVRVSKIPDVTVQRDWTDCLMVIFTGILAITAIVGTYYAVKTLRLLRHEAKIAVASLKQTVKFANAASKTADAAALNAQAIVNAERPWIVIESRRNPGPTGEYFFTVINKGRTPAEFISGDATFSFQTSPASPPAIVPGSAPFLKPDETLIVQGARFEIYRAGIKPWEQVAEIRRRHEGDDSMVLFYYGRIVYQDVIAGGDTEHETCWCYAFMPALDRFIATGPEGYNKHT